jgi:phosphatidylinositol glycan class H protein
MRLSTPPTLYIRRPSPTTAEFTVTTCPPMTVALRVAIIGLLAIRIAVAGSLVLFGLLAIPLSELALIAASSTSEPVTYVLSALQSFLAYAHATPQGAAVAAAAQASPWWTTLPAVLSLLYALLIVRLHTTESLLVLRGLGIQTASGGGLWGHATTRFIPTEKIRDVLINEAFRGFEVRYYLVVLVDGDEDVVVVFPKLFPPRRIVEAVWRGVRGCLYEPDGLRRGDEKG